SRTTLTVPGLTKRKPRRIRAPQFHGQGPTKAPVPGKLALRGPIATQTRPHFSQAQRPTSWAGTPQVLKEGPDSLIRHAPFSAPRLGDPWTLPAFRARDCAITLTL